MAVAHGFGSAMDFDFHGPAETCTFMRRHFSSLMLKLADFVRRHRATPCGK